MTETTANTVTQLSGVVALLTAAIVFAVTGDHTHAGEALAALAGFVGSTVARAPRAVQAAATIGLAGLFALGASGCGASFPTVATLVVDGVEWTCKGAVKLCDVLDSERHNDACRIARESCTFVGVSSETTTTTE